MQELFAKANQVILKSLSLQRTGRSLRFEASVLAAQLEQTILRSQPVEKAPAVLEIGDQAFSRSRSASIQLKYP
jgi:hypothetical protein